MRLIKVAVVLTLLSGSALAFNPLTDIRDNLTWTFGQAAQAGEGFDFAAGKWRTSALAEVAEYRMFAFSYGATFFSERNPQATDTFKVGLLSNFFFKMFTNKPTPEMQWMESLNVGPAYAIPVFSGETGHKGVFLLDFNYRFGGTVTPVSTTTTTTVTP